MGHHWNTFAGLMTTPFGHISLVWGIVPLYFGLLFNELTADKVNFHTAIQTGFSSLWAGAQWLWPFFKIRKPGERELQIGAMMPVNLLVTFLVIALGVVAPSTVQLATGSSGLIEASTVEQPPGALVKLK